MANKTTNFNLDLPTGDELFNPLWPNSNTAKIDTQMKTNQDNSITNADCVFNTNKFIITRNASGGKYFKFIAPADYVAGYTFQVDGTAYDGIVAGTGDSLADGCFMLNHEVIAYIDETSASLAFLVGSSLPEEIDATTLGGHDVDYFGTAAGVQEAKNEAQAAGTVANEALQKANTSATWVEVPLADDSTATMKTDSHVFFNEKAGLAMFILNGYVDFSTTDVIVKLQTPTFTITTGSFVILGTGKLASNGVGTKAIKVTKYSDTVSGEIITENTTSSFVGAYIYQTVIVGAIKAS